MRRIALVVLLQFVSGCAGRSVDATEGATPYLGRHTQEAAARSPLGDLSVQPLAAQDLELRVWGGYGVAGTHGIVLRRRAGAWEAFDARHEHCIVIVSSAAGDTLSAAGEAGYESEALRKCQQDPAGEGRLLSFSRVVVAPRELTTAAGAWDAIVSSGLDALPMLRPGAPGYRDGHTVVIEVRRGSEYRVHELSCNLDPGAPRDEQIDRVFAAVAKELPNGGWLVCPKEPGDSRALTTAGAVGRASVAAGGAAAL